MHQSNRSRHGLVALAAVALACATVAAYWSGLHGSFLLDDHDTVVPLALMQAQGADWWDVLRSAPAHIRERWASNASFLLTNWLAGSPSPPAPFPFKLGNLLIHLACAGTVGVLARRLGRIWNPDDAGIAWVGVLAGGLFALHPMLLSTTLYPVQRMAQLSTFFSLVAVLCYLRWRTDLVHRSVLASTAGILGTLGFAGLAILSKENGVLVPLLIGVVELTLPRWPGKEDPARSRLEAGFGLCCAGPILLGAILLAVRWGRLVADYAARDFTLWERVLTQVHVLADYLGQLLLPRVSAMGLYRDDFPLRTSLDPETLLLALGFALAIATAVVLRRRVPALAFGILWFFAAHSLESTVLPLEMVFEHRNYLPATGLAILVASAIARLPRGPGVALAASVLAVLGVQTHLRANDWSHYGQWIISEAANHPGSLRAATDAIRYRASTSDLAGAGLALSALRERLPGHAQPALLAASLRCHSSGPLRVPISTEDQRRLRQGELGKDSFHLYLSMRDSVRMGRCQELSWYELADIAGAISSNPHVVGNPAASLAWIRLHAEALSELRNWTGVERTITRAINRGSRDPRDYLLLMESHLMRAQTKEYRHARARLLELTGGRLGVLSGRVSAFDDAAARIEAATGEPPVAPQGND